LKFEVDADGIVVRAKGTKFNVKAYPDEHTVTAILTEGVIEIISSGENQKKTIAQPGQMAVYNRPNTTKKTKTPQPAEEKKADDSRLNHQLAVESMVKPEVYTSWKDQRWLIEGSTLGELAPILQRRYAVKVLFDNEALKTYKFRGEIPNLTVEQVARALQLTAPMNYRMSNDTLFFTLDVKRKNEFDQFIK
jgi:ferric-dicitrate binding protein FerR (iron transport regulator)